MNTKSADSISTRIASIMKEEPETTTTILRAHLTISGFKAKDINEALKKEGLVGIRANFVDGFYKLLVEDPTKEEALAYIEGTDGYDETSKNVKAHKNHYMNIFDLTSNIHTQYKEA